MRSEHAAEAGFAGNIGSLIGQHRHDPRRWQLGKPRFVGDPHDPLAFRFAQRVCADGSYGLRAAVATLETLAALPSLQSARIEPGDLAGSP